MRIGYFGDGPWAHNALKKINDDPSIEIAFVMPRYDYRDPVLVSLAEENDIPVEICKDINDLNFLDHIKSYNVDLFVSMSFNQIFKKDTINFPPLGTINCHAGKLPFYRGRNILNWVLINDEKDFGITVHYVDDGIDTGDIILQKCFEITDKDNYNTLLNRAYLGCADVLYEAIKMIQTGKVKRVVQSTIDSVGLYCGKRIAGDELLNWSQNSRDIFNFVRAICKPGPQALTYLEGKPVYINKVVLVEGSHIYKGIEGQIIGKSEQGWYVKTLDTMVEIVEYTSEAKLGIGKRFKNK